MLRVCVLPLRDLEAVRETVRSELEWHKLKEQPEVPLPSDLDAEAGLIGAMFAGDASLKSLSFEDFYDPLHRVLWQTGAAIAEMGNPVSSERILVLMRAQGMPVTDSVCEDVAWLEVNRPLESVESLRLRVLEMAQRRRMISWLKSLELDLRLGSASVASTKSRIRETLARSSPQQTSPLSLVAQSGQRGR